MDERADGTNGARRGAQVVRLQPVALQPRRRTEDRPSAGTVLTQAAERWLLARAAAGERDAWGALVDAHAARVWTWALQDARDPDAAAQICELVWLRLSQVVASLDDEPLGRWLHRAVRDEVSRARRVRPFPLQRAPSPP